MWSAMWPLVWPGVSYTVAEWPAISTVSPSPSVRSMPAMRADSARGPSSWAPCFAFSAALPPVWSWWWWVLTIWVSDQPRSASAASTGAASPGSTTAVAPVSRSWSR